MLSRLSITNYALIESLDFYPGEGLSIITGETGAGKSVMLGALALLKGERADMKMIGDKQSKAVVEAIFTNLKGNVATIVSEFDTDWNGSELIIRREIHPSGRSRAFINDTPATLVQLGTIANELLDIHSQNSNSILSDSRMQLALLDSVADTGKELEEYSVEFKKYVTLRQRINKMKEEAERNRVHAEIITFRLDQLAKLRPKAGELKRIEARYETLSKAEEIKSSLIKGKQALEGTEMPGALELLEDARGALENTDFSLWEEIDPEVNERLRHCIIEIKDISETIEDALSLMQSDPTTMASLSARMREYYSAFKNFKVENDGQLESLHKELLKQYELISVENDTDELEKEARAIAAELKKKGKALSEKRNKAVTFLQQEIESEARQLGLDNLKFEISISEVRLSKTGGDSVVFKASFNKNSLMAPIGEIASGGEMARLMLAIKKITASRLNLPTIIFDEIDTGVSGHIADRMGEMMMEMGRIMQILTITHLPQVAVKGERHFKVYKEDRGEKTVSDVMLLTNSQREEEIGRMLAGEKIDEAALTNARSLLRKK